MIKYIFKMFIASIISLFILSALFTPYYLMPIHKSSTLGNTDYVWEANSHWLKMTEGISYGKFDANGFNNYKVIKNPDIVVVGSSHMEANDVMPVNNMTNLLQSKLGNKMTVYNMGISGHYFLSALHYLPETLNLFKTPPKIVIVEAADVNYSAKQIDEMLSGKLKKTPSYDKGIIAELQKIPYLRLLYFQYSNGLGRIFLGEKPKSPPKNAILSPDEVKSQEYQSLIKYMKDIQKKYNTKIIICYHKTNSWNKDGKIDLDESPFTKAFAEECRENGIAFVDMTDTFKKAYKEQHVLPDGFITGKIGVGHINNYGHQLMADEVYKAICNIEGGK